MKKILLSAVLVFIAVAANAQFKTTQTGGNLVEIDKHKVKEVDYLHSYKFWDNWFIGVQGGISHSMSENTRFGDFFKSEKPSFQINAGKYFYPSFGMRMSLGYKPQKGRSEWEISDIWPEHFGFYDFKVFAAYVDGLVNFTNVLIPYRETRRFNVIGILGFGYNRAFGFDKDRLDSWTKPFVANDGKTVNQTYIVDQKPGNYFAAHVGLEFSYMLNDKWDLKLEGTFNGTDDKYNGKEYDRVYDTYVDVLAGITYHFKDSHNHHRFSFVNLDAAPVILRLKDLLAQERAKNAELSKPIIDTVYQTNIDTLLQTTVSFHIDRYNITEAQQRNVQSVAEFLDKHPNVELEVAGYADIQTANPKYNKQLSLRRAKAVFNMLTNTYKVNPARLTVLAMGDEVQPYANVNEWNRAVMFRTKNHSQLDNEFDESAGTHNGANGVIVIPDGVTKIGKREFAGRMDIKKVVLGKDVVEIEDEAFLGCWNLAEVEIPKTGLKRIGKRAFNSTIVQRLIAPSTLEYIDDEAYLNSSIVEIDIPDGHMIDLGTDVFEIGKKICLRLVVPANSISKFKRNPEWNRFENITNKPAFWNN